MRLYDEIFKNADGASSRCIIVPNGEGYFEGVKAVGDFSSKRIVLCFSKMELEITGEDLCIKKYYDGDLRLSGKIVAMQVVQGV